MDDEIVPRKRKALQEMDYRRANDADEQMIDNTSDKIIGNCSKNINNSNDHIKNNNNETSKSIQHIKDLDSVDLNKKMDVEPMDFNDQLRIYYERFFPFREFHQWLAYGGVQKHIFTNREFSFTLPSEAYLRFKSFQDVQSLKEEIIRLCPVKIDIGAVYNIKPKDKKSVKSSAFTPLERELVFDIDMTDYDEVRTCCSGASICLKCWEFMTIAIKIIHRALSDDFGFKSILWVYSGRRGVHCWVCDESARALTAEARKAIVSYLEIIKGGAEQNKKVNLKGSLHPSLSDAYKVCSQHFPSMMLDRMGILDEHESWTKVLQLIPDEEIRRKLDAEWTSGKKRLTSREKWESIESEIRWAKKALLNNATRDIILQYTYPRLDSAVSVGLNHLLKSPFCAHPKTGRVCVPIDPLNCMSFNPMLVPTLGDLISQLDYASHDGTFYFNIEVPLLKVHLDLFKVFLKTLMSSNRASLRMKREDEEKKLNF